MGLIGRSVDPRAIWGKSFVYGSTIRPNTIFQEQGGSLTSQKFLVTYQAERHVSAANRSSCSLNGFVSRFGA